MKDEIAHYAQLEPTIVAIGKHRVRAFVGDQHARLDGVLWVGETPLRIVTLAGERRIEAIAFDTSRIKVGDPVRCADEIANWPAARPGSSPLNSLAFEPGNGRERSRTAPEPTTVRTGIGAIDGLLPLVQDGVTLILDAGAPDSCVDKLAAFLSQPLAGAASRELPNATHQVLGNSGLALRVALEWAIELGAGLHVEAEPFDVDALLDGQTHTALVRINLRDGLEILAETLDLGHCETQIMLTNEGRIDLTRSTSRMSPDTALAEELGALEAAREQMQIFGEHEISDAHRVLLERAAHLEDDLL